jgi:molybdopterin-guanine dinucleotide biosynthesis protein B
MPPIIPFVGKSGSGKTTFLEKLIPELVARGLRIAIVKHDVHGFELDRPGKDSYRLRHAGAARVAISSPQQFALIGQVDEELALAELAQRYLGDVDLVLAEGYKRSALRKIEVCRAARSQELLCAPDELLAVVSDLRFEVPCPQFGLDDVAGVADLLEGYQVAPLGVKP